MVTLVMPFQGLILVCLRTQGDARPYGLALPWAILSQPFGLNDQFHHASNGPPYVASASPPYVRHGQFRVHILPCPNP